MGSVTLNKLLSEYGEIVIPDIQRDYVLGSNVGNVKELLSAMAQNAREKQPFHFSCIMGHVEKNPFYEHDKNYKLLIYDGQQRLTTLVFLCAFLIKDLPNTNIPPDLQKFRFKHRIDANQYLDRLVNNEEDLLSIVDFTTYSIQQLKKTFEQLNTEIRTPLTLDYLLNEVCMDCVLIKKVGDVEQFFIDLNDGLDLSDYEIYKAELYHKAKKLLKKDFQNFALSMENEWLLLFKKIKNSWEVEEEIEMLFVQFCFHMMWVEEGYTEDYKMTNLNWIKARHLYKLQKIMNHIVKLNPDKKVSNVFVHYSSGDYVYSPENVAVGVFWKTTPFNYNDMLLIFLRSFYKKINGVYQVTFEAKLDVMVWAFLSHIERPSHELQEHLRTMKLLLNRKLIKNTAAYYDNHHKVWHASYGVYGIPSYYSNVSSNFAQLVTNKSTNNDYLRALICLNRKTIDLSNTDFEYRTENKFLNDMIDFEKRIRKSEYYLPIIRELQDLSFINGFVDGLLDENDRPLVDKEGLLKYILECQEYMNQQQMRDIVARLIFKCTYLNIENVENLLFKRNITMRWRAYTGNISIYDDKVSVVTQSLTDVFVDKSFAPILKALIKQDYYKEDRTLTYKLLYLRGHRYMDKAGFYTDENKVITIRNWTGSQSGLFSKKAMYEHPFEEYFIAEQISLLKANYDGDYDIKNILYRKQGSKSFQKAITDKTFYCKKRWLYYAFLQTNLKPPSFQKQSIQQLFYEKQEIIEFENSLLYIPVFLLS